MRILFLQVVLKDIFATKNSRLGYDIHTSVNNRVISQRFYFHVTLWICENKTLTKISKLQYLLHKVLPDFTVHVQSNFSRRWGP